MKLTQYRCSCCDKIRSNKDQVAKFWNANKDCRVKICKKCDKAMKQLKVKFVSTIV